MGEDRTTCAEKKCNDVHLPCRHRHSSTISSGSEDAETESTSTGYQDDDREEELEYGPGIVNKLRTRFLTISLKQNRGCGMRRSCSMENLLDQDRPCRGNIFSTAKRLGDESDEGKNTIWGNLKRAKSMDTLLMDLQAAPNNAELHCESSIKEPKIIRRRDGGLNRAVPTICDEELPKPDTVKTYKRMFEPAESRRGSHSRRPPVLRASAKSGVLAASKINGVIPSSSAKVNGIVTKNKFSAKQSAPVKAQINQESAICSSSIVKQPLVNGNSEKPLLNGNHTVKATPLKITKPGLCNGKEAEKSNNQSLCKEAEKAVFGGNNTSRKEIHFVHNADIICNGNTSNKEFLKTKTVEDSLNNSGKRIITNNSVTNCKPKVPPNRPTFLKNAAKSHEPKGNDRKPATLVKPKSNTVACPKINSKQIVNNEVEKESRLISENELSKDVKLNGNSQTSQERVNDLGKIVEDNNRKNVEKRASEVIDMVCLDKIPAESNGLDKEAKDDGEKLNGVSESIAIDVKVEVEVKRDIKSIKKAQTSTSPVTSMVFDFRGKDVVPHVAVLPTPFGCKSLHPKKRPLLVDGKEVLNGNGVATDDEDEDYVDYSVPPPSGVVFEGENVKIGRGSMLSTRNKDVSICI
ncbi:uncharacterized protein LOC118183550 [Stegodyphus dumicola]|uniref:uncharacterized protein LOC118183550 n=1 Tax=Stegodyphus dumicola TaxID=202533 RepID=UPI0015ACAFDE|nr:uncharacterized protein LOC118183550 [Stegodyphus dumicola]